MEERWGHVRAELARLGLDGQAAAVWAIGSDGDLVLAAGDPPRSARRTVLAVDGRTVGYLDSAEAATTDLDLTTPDLTTPDLTPLALAVDHARLVEAERRARLGAEHARRHVALLRASGVMLGAPHDDPEVVLAGVARIMVPAFADWCAVDVPDGESVRHLAWEASDAIDAGAVPAVLAAHPGWPAAVLKVIASGQPALTIAIGPGAPPAPPGEEDYLAIAAELGLDSAAIIPIRLRGLTVGAMTCGTVRPRRGFRPSDVSAADEVASRAAAAVERALLYRESRDRADQAGHRAAQLRRLTEAGLAVHARHTLDDVLRVAADQARRVMDATACIALLDEGDTAPTISPPAAHDEHDRLVRRVRAIAGGGDEFDPIMARADGWLAAALTDAVGRKVGALVATEKQGDGEYTADDESLLVSLAHLASVALESAGLYERARASEGRLRALVEASPLGIVELTATGTVREANQFARRLFAWHESQPQSAWRLPIPATDHELTYGDVDLAVSTAPLPPSGDDPGGVLVVIADITERKRLEDEVAKTRRMEAVGRMAGGVAHDFNNLLTVVLGHSHLLLRTLPASDLARTQVEAIKTAGERAANLSAQLLTISKGQMVQPTLVDLNQVIASMTTVINRLLPADVELTITTDDNLGPVLADQGQVEQVLLNLTVNARDAMPKGGSLAITTDHRNGTVVLTVADTGEGMTAEVRERCFEPFFTTRRRASGGLGLATVYGIVTQAGGRIRVASQAGAGTTFTLEFPAAAGDAAAPYVPRTHDGRRGHEHVLLVEDDPAVRSLIKDMLERDGYAVTGASGVDGALAIARSTAPIDLVITDVVMPKMDGVELLNRLVDIRGRLPALFVSGFVDDSLEQPEGLPDGAAFLHKPFGPGELGAKVREVLGQGSK